MKFLNIVIVTVPNTNAAVDIVTLDKFSLNTSNT